MNTNTVLLPRQQRQLESFWELLMTSDVVVQKGMYLLLAHKYGREDTPTDTQARPFLQMQGRLRVKGDETTDQAILQEYLHGKYGV